MIMICRAIEKYTLMNGIELNDYLERKNFAFEALEYSSLSFACFEPILQVFLIKYLRKGKPAK